MMCYKNFTIVKLEFSDIFVLVNIRIHMVIDAN